jgi:hypothetical protein
MQSLRSLIGKNMGDKATPTKLPTKWPFPKEPPKPLTKKQQKQESYNQAPKAPF